MEKQLFSAHVLSSSALVMSMLLWGSSFVVMKYAIVELDPMAVVFGRLAIASLCFLPFVRSFSRLPLKRSHILPLLAMGLCEPCLYFLLEARALELTTASQASVITTMLPPLVVLSAWFFLHEKITSKGVAGLLLAAAGAVWLSVSSTPSEYAPNPVRGNLFEFMAMVSATGYIILLKKLSSSLPSLFLTAMQSFVGTIFFSMVILFFGVDLPETYPPLALLSVVYLGVVVSAGAYALYNFGVSKVPANQAAIYINLIPVFAIMLGYLLLGERLNGWQIAACLLVFVGVVISREHDNSN
jgi:drug/metabolite transporter (DMT)-like permease